MPADQGQSLRWRDRTGGGPQVVQVYLEGAAVRGLGQYDAGFSFVFFFLQPSTVVIVGLLSPPLDCGQQEMCHTAATADRGTINGGRLLA